MVSSIKPSKPNPKSRQSKGQRSPAANSPQIRNFLVSSPQQRPSKEPQRRLHLLFYHGNIQRELRALELAFPLDSTLAIYTKSLFPFKPRKLLNRTQYTQSLNHIHTTALSDPGKIVMLGDTLSNLLHYNHFHRPQPPGPTKYHVTNPEQHLLSFDIISLLSIICMSIICNSSLSILFLPIFISTSLRYCT